MNETTTKSNPIGCVTEYRDERITACLACTNEHGGPVDGVIRDGDVYGEQVPYPECFICEEVIRPAEFETVYVCLDCDREFDRLHDAENHHQDKGGGQPMSHEYTVRRSEKSECN